MGSRVTFAILAASLGWGLAGVGTRFVFEDGVTTFTVIVVRSLVATAAVVAIGARGGLRIGRQAWIDGALIGLLRIGLAPIFFIASLNYISAGFESLVITLIPVTTAALARAFLGESLSRRQVAGLVLGLAGTALLIASGETGIADGSGSTVTGGALALAGVVFGSASGVMARRLAPRHETTTLAIPMFVTGGALTLAAGLVLRDIALPGVTARSWWLLVLLGLGSTLLPFFATLYASRHTEATRVALTAYLAPLIGVIGGAILLDEVISTALVVGGALTLAGVVLVSVPAARAPDLVE